MHSIFSHNGATETGKLKSAPRDRFCLYSLMLPLPCMHASSLCLASTVSLRSLFCPSPSLTSCLICLSPSLFLTCPLIQIFFLVPLSFSILSFPFSRETLSTKSRFASYFDKPLKASRFRIFHSAATHRLCHSCRRGHISPRKHTQCWNCTLFLLFFFFLFASHVVNL